MNLGYIDERAKRRINNTAISLKLLLALVLIYIVPAGLASIPFFASRWQYYVVLAVANGLIWLAPAYSLNFYRIDTTEIEDIFIPFKSGIKILRMFLCYFISILIMAAASALFITALLLAIYINAFFAFLCIPCVIPIVIVGVEISMLPYVVQDTATKYGYANTVRHARDIIAPYRLDYIKLMLKFALTTALSILTLGILFIWSLPYMHVANAVFYDEARNAYLRKKEEHADITGESGQEFNSEW